MPTVEENIDHHNDPRKQEQNEEEHQPESESTAEKVELADKHSQHQQAQRNTGQHETLHDRWHTPLIPSHNKILPEEFINHKMIILIDEDFGVQAKFLEAW